MGPSLKRHGNMLLLSSWREAVRASPDSRGGGYLSKGGISRNCHSSRTPTAPKARFMATSSEKTFLSTPISYGALCPGNFSGTFIWHLLTPCPILLCNCPVCVGDFLNHRYHKVLSKDETSLFHGCRTHETVSAVCLCHPLSFPLCSSIPSLTLWRPYVHVVKNTGFRVKDISA